MTVVKCWKAKQSEKYRKAFWSIKEAKDWSNRSSIEDDRIEVRDSTDARIDRFVGRPCVITSLPRIDVSLSISSAKDLPFLLTGLIRVGSLVYCPRTRFVADLKWTKIKTNRSAYAAGKQYILFNWMFVIFYAISREWFISGYFSTVFYFSLFTVYILCVSNDLFRHLC